MIRGFHAQAARLMPQGRLLPVALTDLECASAQGYLVARPEPADLCAARLLAGPVAAPVR